MLQNTHRDHERRKVFLKWQSQCVSLDQHSASVLVKLRFGHPKHIGGQVDANVRNVGGKELKISSGAAANIQHISAGRQMQAGNDLAPYAPLAADVQPVGPMQDGVIGEGDAIVEVAPEEKAERGGAAAGNFGMITGPTLDRKP
jgi:hypothetical protein